MAVAEQLGPTDVAAAIVKDGQLVIIDSRATAWTYKGGKQEGPDGEPIPAPADAEAAFKVGDKLVVVDGKGMCWTYNVADSSWSQGHSLEDKAAPDAEESDDVPWVKGVNIEGSPEAAAELRKAKATVAAAEGDAEGGSKKKAAA